MYLDKNVRHDYVPAVAGLQSRLLEKEKEYLVLQKYNKHVHIFIDATTWISVSESSLKNLGSMSGSGSRECGCCSTNQR